MSAFGTSSSQMDRNRFWYAPPGESQGSQASQMVFIPTVRIDAGKQPAKYAEFLRS